MLTAILTALGIGGKVVEAWQNRKTLEVEMETRVLVAEAEAKIARLQKAQEAEAAWDTAAVQQMDRSWKDEWFTILLSIPLVMAFLPFHWAQDTLAMGFHNLEQMPDWFKIALATAIAASFGYRKLIEFMANWKK